MKKFTTLIAFGSFMAAACGGTLARQPLTGPEKGGDAWTEVTSAHFSLRTDLDPQVARKVSAELEAIFSALSDFGFDSPIEVRTRMDVVYFQSREEYVKVAPKASSGVFLSGDEVRDFERTPIALLQGDFTRRAKETVQHELTHFFVHAHYPQAPVWLNEGLAQYFQTLEIEDGTAIIGRPLRRQRFWKAPWAAKVVEGEYSLSIPMSEAPTAGALLSMSPEEFEGAADEDVNTPKGVNALRKMATNYAGAWSLVHLLMADSNYRPLFEDYRRRLLNGAASDQAWNATVGKVPSEKLEKDYTDSLVPFETLTYRTKYTPPPAPAKQVRTLSPADVHVLWARLRNWKTPEGKAEAETDMKEAAALEPHHPELAALKAYWEIKQGNDSAAEDVLKAALTERPNDPRLLNALGWVEVSAIERKQRPPAALDPIAEKLSPVAKTAAELDLLGWNSFYRNNVDAALAYEKRAVTTDPSCYNCFFAASIMLSKTGRVREALNTATLALRLLPDGMHVPAAMAQRLETYRRRLNEGASSTPNPEAAPKP